MSKQRLKTGVAVGAAALAIVGFGAPMLARAADHLDAPGKLQSPMGRHDADINDVYAFPAGSDDTVLAMTTHPALGVVTTQTAYATDVLVQDQRRRREEQGRVVRPQVRGRPQGRHAEVHGHAEQGRPQQAAGLGRDRSERQPRR